MNTAWSTYREDGGALATDLPKPLEPPLTAMTLIRDTRP